MRSRTSRRTRPRRARASGAASGPRGRARAAAPRPRRSRAPGRTCTHAGRGGPRRRRATRAGSRPRHRHGSGGSRAAARARSGSASRPRVDDEGYARPVSDLSALVRQLVAIDSVNPTLVPGGAGEAEIGRFAAGWLAERGVDVEVEELEPGRINVVGRVRGTGGGRVLLLNGHLDTVGLGGPDG